VLLEFLEVPAADAKNVHEGGSQRFAQNNLHEQGLGRIAEARRMY
jgi:hypothetical protein